MAAEDFYVRYYVGHKGKFGHEFLEFEFRPDGKVLGLAVGALCASQPFAFVQHASRSIQQSKPCSDAEACGFAALQLRYANNSNYKNDTMIRWVRRGAHMHRPGRSAALRACCLLPVGRQWAVNLGLLKVMCRAAAAGRRCSWARRCWRS